MSLGRQKWEAAWCPGVVPRNGGAGDFTQVWLTTCAEDCWESVSRGSRDTQMRVSWGKLSCMGRPRGNHKPWPLPAVGGILRRVWVGGDTGRGGPAGAGSAVAWVSVGWLWITCRHI